MEHRLHIGVVPAFDKAAGVFCVILYRNNAAALDHNGDVFLPTEVEFGGLGGVIAVLKGSFISAGC